MIKLYFNKLKFVTKIFLFIAILVTSKANAQVDLLQTTNNIITTAISSCGSGNNVTSSNDYARLYNLADLGYSSFLVNKVSFAVHGFQLGTAANFPVNVNVYASTEGTDDADLTLVGQTTVNITSAMVGTIVEVPFTTPANVTSPAMLIVVSAPDGVATSTGIFLGANSNGQTAPGYIKAAGCGLPNFTSYTVVGDTRNLILFPSGNPTPLDVKDFNTAAETVVFYPNPAKEILYFSEEIQNVKITDISGREITNFSAENTSANIANLANGIYLLSGTTTQGILFTKKIIKE